MKRPARFSLDGARPGLAALAPLGALALAAVVITADFQAPRSPAGGSAAAGERLMAAGDYARAVSAMRAAYREAPSPERRLALARALLGAGDYGGALDLLSRTEDGQGEPPPAYAGAARHIEAEALIRAQRFDEAAALAHALSDMAPGDGRASLVMARASYGVGARAAAEAHLRAALRAGGEALADAWLLRARLALDAQDVRLARSAIARAREAGAAESLAAALAVEAEIRAGALDRAEALIDARAAASGPARRRDARTEKLRAHIDMVRGDYRSAARRVRAISPWLFSEPQGTLFAALVHESDGDEAQAESLYLAALRTAPDDPLVLDAYAAFLTRSDRLETAPAMIDRLGAADPGAARFRRAALAQSAGQADALLSIVRAGGSPARPLSPSARVFGPHAAPAVMETEAAASLAVLFDAVSTLQDGEAGGLTPMAARLLAREGDAAAAVLAGELLLAAEDDRGALAAFERALSAEPAMHAGLAGLLRVHVRAGAPEGALERLDAAAAESLAARLLLARLYRHLGRGDVAASTLIPVSRMLLQQTDGALFFATLLNEQNAGRQLARFAGEMRRAQSAAPETAEILAMAGRPREAASAARAALLDAPADPARRALYAKLMAALGRETESAALLGALPHPAPMAADGGGSTAFETLRRGYLATPENAGAARRYADALLEAGERAAARRVRREGRFWALPASYPLEGQSDS